MNKIDNILQEFRMLDACWLRAQNEGDIDGALDSLYVMQDIVKRAKPWHAEIFEQYPEYKEVFSTLEKL